MSKKRLRLNIFKSEHCLPFYKLFQFLSLRNIRLHVGCSFVLTLFMTVTVLLVLTEGHNDLLQIRIIMT